MPRTKSQPKRTAKPAARKTVRKSKAKSAKKNKKSSKKKNASYELDPVAAPVLLSLGTVMVQNQILEMIAKAEPLDHILNTLTRIIEQHSSPGICSIYLLNSESKTLHCGSAPSLPKDFIEALQEVPIGPKYGSCGAAVHHNKAVIIEDIKNSPLWKGKAHLPLKLGLKASWSVPIQDRKGKPQGAIALYYTEKRKPTDEEHEILFNSSRLAGIAIEHYRADEELRTSRAQMKELVDERTQDMTEAIRQLQDEIVQRMQIENSLKESNQQLQTLSSHLQTVREEERANISREIHDELGQILTTLKMEITLLKEKGVEEDLPIQEDLDSMTQLVETTLNTVRRISAELRPGILDVLGLAEALEWQVQEFQNRTHIRIKKDIERFPLPAERDFSTACFRVCQEALTNVARHANATRVTVSFKKQNGNLELSISDNGSGIPKNEISNLTSLGLLGMRERVQNLGGKLSVKGSPKKGTTVLASFPLDSRP